MICDGGGSLTAEVEAGLGASGLLSETHGKGALQVAEVETFILTQVHKDALLEASLPQNRSTGRVGRYVLIRVFHNSLGETSTLRQREGKHEGFPDIRATIYKTSYLLNMDLNAVNV